MMKLITSNYFYFAIKNLSQLNSLGWLRGKKEAIINNDNINNNDFQNALDDALNYQTIEKDSQRISKLKSYINKYNWKGINFPAGPKEWQKFDHKKQVILLTTGDGKKYHYLAVTNLSALLQKISSNHKEDFYCLNCFNSYTTKNKLKEHEEICNNHDSCHIEMPKWVEKILKYNPGEKSLKAPFAIYLDLECLLKKEQSCQNNPKKSYTEKKARHEPSGWAMFTRCSFDEKEN